MGVNAAAKHHIAPVACLSSYFANEIANDVTPMGVSKWDTPYVK
jgi:hypothetical protein